MNWQLGHFHHSDPAIANSRYYGHQIPMPRMAAIKRVDCTYLNSSHNWSMYVQQTVVKYSFVYKGEELTIRLLCSR